MIGTPLIELNEVDSTNNFAINLINQGIALEGTAILSHFQLKGKGQRRKIWNAEKDSSILLSVILSPNFMHPQTPFALICSLSLGVWDFFQELAGPEFRIKWPNDLYWRDRKAAGILIENKISSGGSWTWSVAGIGINVNQEKFPEDIKNPVSIRQITGRQHDIKALTAILLKCLDKRYEELRNGKIKEQLALYNDHLYCIGRKVQLMKTKNKEIINCLIKGVNEKGALEVSGCRESFFSFEEISWII